MQRGYYELVAKVYTDGRAEANSDVPQCFAYQSSGTVNDRIIPLNEALLSKNFLQSSRPAHSVTFLRKCLLTERHHHRHSPGYRLAPTCTSQTNSAVFFGSSFPTAMALLITCRGKCAMPLTMRRRACLGSRCARPAHVRANLQSVSDESFMTQRMHSISVVGGGDVLGRHLRSLRRSSAGMS